MFTVSTQQVNAQIELVLELPVMWDETEISTFLIATVGSAFAGYLGSVLPDRSTVNVDFQEEAEIYGSN